MARTLSALDKLGKRVVLVGQVPEIGYDVPSSNYSARLTGRDVEAMIAPTRTEYLERSRIVQAVLSRVSANYDLVRLEPADVLCPGERCRVVIDDTPRV